MTADPEKTYIETDEYAAKSGILDQKTQRAERASESIQDLKRKIEEADPDKYRF